MKSKGVYDPKMLVWNEGWKSKEYEKKQRILVVGPASPSKGGIPSYIDSLLSSQLRDRFLLGLLDPLAMKERREGKESRFCLKEVRSGLKVIAIFVKALQQFEPALVHIHTSSYWGFYEKAILLAIVKTMFKRKVILHIHGGEFDLFYFKSSCKKLIGRIISWADKTLIVSKKIRQNLGLTNAVQVDNCVCFRDEMLNADKERLRKTYGIPMHKTVFLSVALLQKRKGIYETLETFKNIHVYRKDFMFVIAGEGPERERIRNFVENNRLEENVKIFGYISGKKKEDLFVLSDVFVSNSIVESFGISILEAVGYGLFVITTPVGIASSTESVFNKENCIIVPIKNNELLRKGILRVLNREIDIENIKKKTYFDFKKRFDIWPVFENVKSIYQETLEYV